MKFTFSELRIIKERLYYRLLKKSGIWRYWYEKFLNELCYDLEIIDLEKEEIQKKYNDKLIQFRKNKNF